jgi:hypothetical protein
MSWTGQDCREAYPFCQTCLALTEALRDASHKLTDATSRMFSISGTESELFDAAQLEVQRLRDECQDTKLELKRHGAGHQLRIPAKVNADSEGTRTAFRAEDEPFSELATLAT